MSVLLIVTDTMNSSQVTLLFGRVLLSLQLTSDFPNENDSVSFLRLVVLFSSVCLYCVFVCFGVNLLFMQTPVAASRLKPLFGV